MTTQTRMPVATEGAPPALELDDLVMHFGPVRAFVDIGGRDARRHDAEPRQQVAAAGRGGG